jgi:hypothetical protein
MTRAKVEPECKNGIVIPTYKRGEAFTYCIQSARNLLKNSTESGKMG